MSTKNFPGSGKHRPAPANNHGFTLVEMLISTAILAMIIYLASLSLGTFLALWHRSQAGEMETLQDFRARTLVRASLESCWDYYVTDSASEAKVIYYPFFKGRETQVEFVTISSVFWQGCPAVARLQAVEGDTPDSLSLVYEEAPLNRNYLRYNNDKVTFTRTLHLQNRVKRVKLRYLGVWEVKSSSAADEYETVYRWQDAFSGKQENRLPARIELTITTAGGDEKLLFPIRGNNVYKQNFLHPEY